MPRQHRGKGLSDYSRTLLFIQCTFNSFLERIDSLWTRSTTSQESTSTIPDLLESPSQRILGLLIARQKAHIYTTAVPHCQHMHGTEMGRRGFEDAYGSQKSTHFGS